MPPPHFLDPYGADVDLESLDLWRGLEWSDGTDCFSGRMVTQQRTIAHLRHDGR